MMTVDKIILFLLILFLNKLTVAQVHEKNLTCSRNGTDVIFVNGINWSHDDAKSILKKKIVPNFQIKDELNPGKMITLIELDTKQVTFKLSYNNRQSYIKDLLESSSQKISESFNISLEKAFVANYYATIGLNLADSFYENVLKLERNSFAQIKKTLFETVINFSINDLIKKSFEINTQDSSLLKQNIAATLLNGKKLILLTESQGNLFANQAIKELTSGEKLTHNGISSDLKTYENIIGQLQVATPTNSILKKSKYVINDRDVINLVFFDAPPSNFDLEVLPDPDPRDPFDTLINHMLPGTYLNENNVKEGDLPRLKNFTVQSLVDLASMLDSSCPVAKIEFKESESTELTIDFDATDYNSAIPNEDKRVSAIEYHWSFGDGTLVTTTEPKISHTYLAEGTYLVTLNIKDKYGSIDSISVEVPLFKKQNGPIKICAVGPLNSILNFNFQDSANANFSLKHQSGVCECKQFIPNSEMTEFSITAYLLDKSYLFENLAIYNMSSSLFLIGFGVDNYFNGIETDYISLVPATDLTGICSQVIEK